MKVYSRPKHHTKLGLVKICIDKESEGWECVVPIHFVTKGHQEYRRKGDTNYEFKGYSQSDGYYKAIYSKILK